MKAQLGMKWAFLAILVVLVVIGFVLSPYTDAVDEAIKETSRIYAVEVAGIINILQGAPDTTRYEYTLPDVECIVTIENSVNFTIRTGEGENSYVADFITTPAKVDESCFTHGVEEEERLNMGCRETYGTIIFSRVTENGDEKIKLG